MELTIDQALQKAIEAHRAGQVQEADRLYTAILKAQPKHPDANHNLGILAVGLGKVQEALPFLKTALEASPGIAQFWLSYVDALIELGRFTDAQAVLDQANNLGAQGEGFGKLAKSLVETGKFDQAIELLKDKINQFPEDADLFALLSHCCILTDQLREAKFYLGEAKKIAPDNASVGWNTVRLKLMEKKPLEALKLAKVMHQRFPDDIEGMLLLGICFRAKGEVSESLYFLNKAIEINPNYAEALMNRGLIKFSQENKLGARADLKLAHRLKPHVKRIWNLVVGLEIEAQEYSGAIVLLINMLEIDPLNPDLFAKLALCYQHLKDFGLAIENYKKALALKPDFVEAYNNLAVAFIEIGKLEEAIEAYTNVIHIQPNSTDAMLNLHTIMVQLPPKNADYGDNFFTSEAQVNTEVVLKPKYQILNALKAYLNGDLSDADSHNKNFKAYGVKLLEEMSPEDQVFSQVYSEYIEKLLKADWDEEVIAENELYHLGESHCLSYAHRNIVLRGTNFRIAPRITFGAKAFHFSHRKQNIFTSITKAHLLSIPSGSTVFLSFGEIDCRPTEGFISAAMKYNATLEELIDQTVQGYVNWFLDHNAGQRHTMYFVNVPAPVYNGRLTADLNFEVARTVVLFNKTLEQYSLQKGFDVVDVFKFTLGDKGFSNGLFHIDKRHLGAKALPEIQQQLSQMKF